MMAHVSLPAGSRELDEGFVFVCVRVCVGGKGELCILLSVGSYYCCEYIWKEFSSRLNCENIPQILFPEAKNVAKN